MKIGPVTLENPTILAPLAGITNLPFRLLAKEAGCALVCSEMISSNGLVYNSQKTRQLMESDPAEKPLSIQLFGANPSIMAEAAAMVEAAGADILDINFGCSVKKILKSGSGAALMATPQTAEKLLKAVRKAVRIPVTIKIRSGWDASGRQALEIARMAEGSGIDAIALHPRTAVQGFRGKSDWALIATLKKTVAIPVIGNGDIETAADAVRMLEETGCDAVMIGRAAIGNPHLFTQVNDLLGGRNVSAPAIRQQFETMIRYLEASVQYYGEEHACRMMRSRLNWFVKGLPRCTHFRKSTTQISTEKEARHLIRTFFAPLLNDPEQNQWET